MNEHIVSFKVVSPNSAKSIAYRLSISLILQELGVNDVYIDSNNTGKWSYNLKEYRQKDMRNHNE